MQARTVRSLVVLSAVLLASVGGSIWYSRRGARVASPGRPVIFYDENGSPTEQSPPLSRQEIKKILDRVATRTRDPVWLIWVRPSQVYEAYVIPDKATPRTRVGRAFRIRKSEPAMSMGAGGTYMQVCAPGCAFSWDSCMTPSGAAG